MAFVIPTIFSAIDRFSRPLSSMGRSLDTFADRFGVADARMERMNRRLSGISDKAFDVAKSTGVAGLAIVAPLGLAVNSAIKFEDRMADVAKTSGLTGTELDGLGQDILSLSRKTRTSIEGLQQIAAIGGQFGIKGRADIVAFTDSVDKFNVALGSDFSGGVEDAARSIGGLKTLFKETRDLNIAEAITKSGSAINALSAQGVRVPQITEFISRVGQLPDAVKPAMQDVAALGAVFDKSGITAEVSARAVGDVLQTAAKNVPGFAHQMRMGAGEVKDLINTNPAEFLKKFSSSLAGLDATQFSKIAEGLKLEDSGSLKILGTLSTNTAMLTGFQKIANDEFARGTSILDEYNTKNNTTAGKLEKAKNNFEALSITVGLKLAPVLSKLIDQVVPLISSFVDWIGRNENLTTGILYFAGTLGGLLLTVSGFATVIGFVTKAMMIWNSVGKILNLTLRANPIGVIITIIGVLVAAILWVSDHTEGWGKQWDATTTWMGDVFKTFVLALKVHFLWIYNGFMELVDGIVSAWKWGQNMIGNLSDEQYKKDMANIAARKKARMEEYAQAKKEFASVSERALAGPGWHVTMKEDPAMAVHNSDKSVSPALNPKVAQGNAFLNSWKNMEPQKVEVSLNAPPGVVDDVKASKNINVKTKSSFDHSKK